MPKTTEGSPLLEGATGPMRDWNYGDQQGSGRALLADSRRRRRQGAGAAADGGGARRNWRVSAGVAGVVMFAMALAGLVAIFSTIQGERAPSNASALQQMKDVAVEAPAAAAATNAGSSAWRNAPPRGHDTREELSTKVGRPEGQGEKVAGAADASLGRDRGVSGRDGAETPQSKPSLSGAAGASGDGDGGGAAQEAPSSDPSPNVFVIMIDDMGWNDIGYQSTDLKDVTPNLDKLAAGGVKMTNYYTMSICTPARASLMTGRYVTRYGLQYSVIQPGAPWGLPLVEKVFPQYMKDAGYETHMIGKWHLGAYTSHHIPSQRGFDTFMGYLNDEEMYWTHQSWSAHLHGRKFFDFGFGNATGYYDIIDRPLPDHPREGSKGDDDYNDDDMLSPTSSKASSVSETGVGSFMGKYSTQVFQDRAVDILKEKTPFDDEPLFMYLAHQAVHDPLGLPPDGCFSDDEIATLDKIYENSVEGKGAIRQRFAKVLMYLDHTIGELVEYMEAEGWMENSIIVVASDNGGCPSCGGNNYPLRGIKHSYWEGGVKVPSFVYSTSHIPEERWGSEYNGLMHVTDWLPTLATAAGVELTGSAGRFDGVDHWSFIIDGDKAAEFDSPRTEMLYNFDPYILWSSSTAVGGNQEFQLAQGAFRSGKYKYIANVWCTSWYTFDKKIAETDILTNNTLTCDGSPCGDCGQGCTTTNYTDYLFNLDDDPREQHNLIAIFPEIGEELRNRWVEVAEEEFGPSLYESINHDSYYVWAKYNWWMVPWWNLYEGATEDPYGIGSSSSSSSSNSSSSSGNSTSSSSSSSDGYSSWTSTMASSV